MRESLFPRFTGEAAPGAATLDLRADILKGLLVPLIVLGWLGMSYGLALAPNRPDWLIVACFGVAMLAGFAGVALLAAGHPRAALWTCSLAAWGAATAHAWIVPSGLGLFWVGIACALATLLLGAAAGWAAAAVSVLGLAGAMAAGGGEVSAVALAPAAAPLAALVLVTHVLSRVLFQTVRWMSEGYSLAHRQADQLRDQSAQLSAALKSLGQTSFSLARANEQLEIMVKYAEDARRSKQEFAANISHELRTPLNLIIGFSDVILNAPGTYNLRRLPAGLLADIHVINQNAQHLLKLVNDILDLSQMDVAYMTIAREPVRIDGFIQGALQDFAQLIESRGLFLRVEVEPGLPEIYADKTRIRQVLLNLVNNALRFTDRGGITVRAYAGDPVTGWQGETVISVSDTGIGIAEADLERIFEPFTKIDLPDRQRGGTGLGLTISKRFVELHGGRMWVDSAPGAGSTFHFTLPVAPPPPSAPLQGTLREVHRQEVGALAVVEGNPVLSRLLERHLRGMPILHVPSIDELFAQSGPALPEAVLINQPPGHPLPDWRADERFANIPVLSCYLPDVFGGQPAGAAPGDGSVLPAEGALRRYLVKPVARERLYEVLGEMLSAGPPASRRGAARILVVEDDEDALHLLGRLLRAAPDEARCGYEAVIPVEMRSGEQARDFLRTLAAGEPAGAGVNGAGVNGLLLDIRLGAVSGWDLLDELDRQPALRRIPVCLVSGLDTPDSALISPYLTFVQGTGLPARELTQAVAALMRIALPGIDVTAQ